MEKCEPMFIHDKECVPSCTALGMITKAGVCVQSCEFFDASRVCYDDHCPADKPFVRVVSYNEKVLGKECLAECAQYYLNKSDMLTYCVTGCPDVNNVLLEGRCLESCPGQMYLSGGQCVQECGTKFYYINDDGYKVCEPQRVCGLGRTWQVPVGD